MPPVWPRRAQRHQERAVQISGAAELMKKRRSEKQAQSKKEIEAQMQLEAILLGVTIAAHLVP